jgi:hypothetical protein
VDVDEYATALADAIVDALPAWVERSVAGVLASAGLPVGDGVRDAAGAAGRRAAEEVGAEVRALLSLDVDSQRSTPLTILRDAVRYPTEVLLAAGVPAVEGRDEVRARLFPDDVYDLSPATFADVDPRLAEPGLAWGAAKAFTHLQRHSGAQGGGGEP